MAESHKERWSPDKIRAYKLSKGAHKLRNRSSKHERWMKALKPYVRCISNAALKAIANFDAKHAALEADMELRRRDKNRPKTEIRKQRYLEKLAKKRAA